MSLKNTKFYKFIHKKYTKLANDERGIAAIVTIIITAIVSMAVEKVIQVATGQDLNRTTIPIGPFQFQVGKGKPSYGFGIGIPKTPITIGVMAGPDQKPSWGVGVKIGDIKVGGQESGVKIGLSGNYNWTGSEWTKGAPGAGITVTKYDDSYSVPEKFKKEGKLETRAGKVVVVNKNTGEYLGKASAAQKQAWKIGLEGEYDIKDKTYGIELKGEAGDWTGAGIRLTQPKKGKPNIKLTTFFKKIDGKDVAVGVTLGKGKPVWEFGAGVDVGKKFKLDFGADFAKGLDNWYLGVTKYKIMDFEKGTKKVAAKATYKYNEKTKKGTIQLGTSLPIPVTVNLGADKEKRFVVDTENIINYITQKLIPDPYAKTWQEKINYGLQEVLLKGAKAVAGGELPNWLMKDLAALGFGGERGIVFQKAVPDDYLRFAQSLMPTTEKGLKEWQVQLLSEQKKLHELLYKQAPALPSYSLYKQMLEQPGDAKLLAQLQSGEINFKDFFLGRSFSKIDEAYQAIREEMQQPTETEQKLGYIKKLRELDPYTLSEELKTAIRDSSSKAELVKNLSPEKNPTFKEFGEYLTKDFQQTFAGGLSSIGYGLWNLPTTAWNLTFAPLFDEKTGHLKQDLFAGGLKGLSQEQLMLPTAVKTVTWDFATSIWNFWKNIVTAGPHSQKDIDAARSRDDYTLANKMAKTNEDARMKALWNSFYTAPLTFINNIAITASPIFRAAGGISKIAGLGKLAEGTKLAASAADTAFMATNPFGMLSWGLRKGISKVASSPLGDMIVEAIPALKYRKDINAIWNEYKTARILEGTKRQLSANDLIQGLEQFPATDQWGIAKAAMLARGENFAAELPAHLKTNAAALAAAKEFRRVSDSNTLYALESKLMSIEQLEARRYAPLITEMEKRGRPGVTAEMLRVEGYDPAYIPLLAERTVMAPEGTLSRLYSVFHKEKMKPYVGDLENVVKLDPSQAVAVHQKLLANMKITQEYMQKLKQQGFVKPFDFRKQTVPDKGYKLIDIDSIVPYFEAQTKFGQNFLDNLNLTKNADQALALTLQKWTNIESTEALARTFKDTGKTLYQVPTYAANIIKSNFGPIMKIPIYDNFNDAVRDAVLAFRPAWVVNDLKNNAINYLLSGRNPFSILEALKKKWEPIFPTQLQNTGLAAEQIFAKPSTGFYGRIKTAIDNMLPASVKKFRNAMYSLDRLQDNAFKKGFFFNDLEQYARRTVMADTTKSFFLAESELRRLTDAKLAKWAAHPQLYAAEATPAINAALRAVDDWIYSFNRTWPLLTESERVWMKRALFFPEIAYWGAKKILKMPIAAPLQTKLLSEFAQMRAEWDDPEDKPAYLIGAEKIGENMFLRTLAGTIYDPEWGGLNYQGLGMLSPTLKTAVELAGGVDLRTGKPYTSVQMPWVYNKETNRFEPVGNLREPGIVREELAAQRTGLDALFNEMQTLLQYDEDISQQLRSLEYTKNRIKELEMELEAIADSSTLSIPAAAERILRNFPQYQWLEDALVPFAKYGDFTWTEPEIIYDSKTGEPKYPISSWLSGFRLLGLSIAEEDIGEWQKKEEKKEKREISLSFGELLRQLSREKPEQLQTILDQMEKGEVPFEVPGFKESPIFKMPAVVTKLELPEADRKAFISAVADAREADLGAIATEKERAIETSKAISKEFYDKVKDAINAIANERESQVRNYYNAMLDKDMLSRMYESVLGARKIEEELKALRDMPVDAYDIAKRVIKSMEASEVKFKPITVKDFSNAISQYLSDMISGNQILDFDDLSEVFSSQLGVKVAQLADALKQSVAELLKMPAELATKKAKDTWLRTRLEQLAFNEWKKNVLGTKTLPHGLERLTPTIEQEIGKDIVDWMTLGITEPFTFDMKTLFHQEDLDKAITEINARTSDIMTSLAQLQGKLDTELHGLIIKGVVDRSEELKKQAKTAYKKKARIANIFTQERIDAAQKTLELAVGARRDFLGSTAFQSWQDYFDPNTLAAEQAVPLTRYLTALTAGRYEGEQALGAQAWKEYQKTEPGQAYLSFEDELIKLLRELLELLNESDTKKALREYENFYTGNVSGKTVSAGNFKGLYNAHLKATSFGTALPVMRLSEGAPVASIAIPANWSDKEFNLKFQELDKYSRTYITPESQLYQKAVTTSYKTLSRKLRQASAGAKSQWFVGVLLQK